MTSAPGALTTRARAAAVLATGVLIAASCSGSGPAPRPVGSASGTSPAAVSATSSGSGTRDVPGSEPAATPTALVERGRSAPPGPGGFTFAFAGDVNFADRTAARLARDPTTAFGVAAAAIGAADLSMVNLETAIATDGRREAKSFTFRAPPTALNALRAAGVDVATMANNHAADYGATGLRETLAAIGRSAFPVVGIGRDAPAAYAPWVTDVRGTEVAVIGASQVQDETLAHFTAERDTAGIANAYSARLVASVRAARALGYVVVVYVHWGTEYTTCPNPDQAALAATLSQAGAAAVIGTHAHLLQGAGWRADGTYVAYGLSNYLWWRSFGNAQDDNGVLTLTFGRGRVVAATFGPAHLDRTGVPVPAVAADRRRIEADWDQARRCAGLRRTPEG